MSLRFSFVKGVEQSLSASNYFGLLADELVRDFIGEMTARQYSITEEGRETMALRIWSVDPWLDERNKDERLAWLASVMADVAIFDTDPTGPEEVHPVLAHWSTPNGMTTSWFIEQTLPGGDTPMAPRLSVGVLGGRIVFLSAPRVMYVRLDAGAYGLAIAGFGSFLVQTAHSAPVPSEYRRRA